MSEVNRKKSTSSDSELSDGWSYVEHQDTVPLAPRSGDMSSHLICSTPQSTPSSAVRTQPVSPSEETSSDAESVEIIEEEKRLGELIPAYAHNISRVTDIHRGATEKEDLEREKDPLEVKEVMLNEPGSEFFINTSFYSNEWFRLLIFISSLIALLLLLVSYTSLFFKEQAYSKSDGLIVLPDEDLSSLIADLTLFKEENSRLKEELNMIKYEYGNNKKVESKNNIPHMIPSPDEIIGLEVISDDSPPRGKPVPFSKPVKIPLNPQKVFDKQHRIPDDNMEPTDVKIDQLLSLEDSLNDFVKSIGLNNVIVSSYEIKQNLNSINRIVLGLKLEFDKDASPKRESKMKQINQKLIKLQNKIDQDFKKSFDKISSRINKFYKEFLEAYCRVKGGIGEADIDCSKINSGRKEYSKNNDRINKDKEVNRNNHKKETMKFEESSNLEGDKFDSYVIKDNMDVEQLLTEGNDFKQRYKRDNDVNNSIRGTDKIITSDTRKNEKLPLNKKDDISNNFDKSAAMHDYHSKPVKEHFQTKENSYKDAGDKRVNYHNDGRDKENKKKNVYKSNQYFKADKKDDNRGTSKTEKEIRGQGWKNDKKHNQHEESKMLGKDAERFDQHKYEKLPREGDTINYNNHESNDKPYKSHSKKGDKVDYHKHDTYLKDEKFDYFKHQAKDKSRENVKQEEKPNNHMHESHSIDGEKFDYHKHEKNTKPFQARLKEGDKLNYHKHETRSKNGDRLEDHDGFDKPFKSFVKHGDRFDASKSDKLRNYGRDGKYDKKMSFDTGKCINSKCEKKRNKEHKSYKNKQKPSFRYVNHPKKTPGQSTLHNESIYSKIIGGNLKTETNGEWYLDMGEVRNQKRLRRALRDRTGWIFDRAMVREWCRYNSGSSLCTSFGQNCDYCS